MAPEMLTQTLCGMLFPLLPGTLVKGTEEGDGPVARVGYRPGPWGGVWRERGGEKST